MTGQAEIETFDAHRSHLVGVAYRMLGSVADAEDVVQDTFLRWQGADDRDIRSAKAWLTTVTTRLAIDHLRSARVRRETYVGSWLPEPMLTGSSTESPFPPPDQGPELLESLSTAMLMLLEQLSPAERAAFLLHDVFDYDYDQVAPMLERSATACRQLVSRARRRVKEGRPRFETNATDRNRVLSEFGEAVRSGDTAGLMSLLNEDVTLLSDGGGRVTSALNPILGQDKVARFLLGVSTKQPDGSYFQVREVNGAAGMVGYVGDTAYSVISFDLAGGHIVGIHIVNNPEKLTHLGPPMT
jgi:RNA polymerase sigma-70 factor, ECF subfamily